MQSGTLGNWKEAALGNGAPRGAHARGEQKAGIQISRTEISTWAPMRGRGLRNGEARGVVGKDAQTVGVSRKAGDVVYSGAQESCGTRTLAGADRSGCPELVADFGRAAPPVFISASNFFRVSLARRTFFVFVSAPNFFAPAPPLGLQECSELFR